MSMKTDGKLTLLYGSLVRSYSRCDKLGGAFSRNWWKAWNRSCARYRGPVKARVHGRDVVLNFGNTYPINTRRYPTYNNPLVELVYQAHEAKGAPIVYVDIGAATGDSILLVHANCPGMIGTTYCVDGDDEFFAYLTANVAHIPGVKLRKTLLSSGVGSVKSLVRTHGGTASAQGGEAVEATTLDSVIERDAIGRVDVLKCDVDGYDGQILMGSEEVLTRDRPAVIFEWHPILCQQTGNNWSDHFKVLVGCEYDRFAWFTKFGEFSHFTSEYDPHVIDTLADFCLKSKVHSDLHYDVVALHKSSQVSLFDLADLEYANHRRSPI